MSKLSAQLLVQTPERSFSEDVSDTFPRRGWTSFDPRNVPSILGGAHVATDHDQVAIHRLEVGDRVLMEDGTFQEVLEIRKTVTEPGTRFAPVALRGASIANGQTLHISHACHQTISRLSAMGAEFQEEPTDMHFANLGWLGDGTDGLLYYAIIFARPGFAIVNGSPVEVQSVTCTAKKVVGKLLH